MSDNEKRPVIEGGNFILCFVKACPACLERVAQGKVKIRGGTLRPAQVQPIDSGKACQLCGSSRLPTTEEDGNAADAEPRRADPARPCPERTPEGRCDGWEVADLEKHPLGS